MLVEILIKRLELSTTQLKRKMELLIRQAMQVIKEAVGTTKAVSMAKVVQE